MVALATSVHASPGVYALLLGSGVSTGAGVMTGWQVVTDLVRKMAAAQAPDDFDAADEVGDEPEAWWAEHGDGQPLGYSTLLGELASTPAARQALLAGYFEPSEADRAQGLKMPSAAHRAIAQLVSRGAVRVILTTNFDRLTERALEDAGVPPQVLHRPDQLASATALAHAKVTVIKLHGDYADLEQRNTADELAEYPEALAAYLGRLLDEYGLIVSGCGPARHGRGRGVHRRPDVDGCPADSGTAPGSGVAPPVGPGAARCRRRPGGRVAGLARVEAAAGPSRAAAAGTLARPRDAR